MNKLDAAQRLRELAETVMEPWREIHGMVLDVDGSHTRIWGLGIKDHSVRAHQAMLTAARRYETAHDQETKTAYIPVRDNDTPEAGGGEEGRS